MLLMFDMGVTAVPSSLIDFTDFILGGGCSCFGDYSM